MRTQRYAVARRKGRSSGVGGVHDGSSGKGRCSAVLTVTFFIILAWLGFLLYCWRSGRLLQTAKLPMPASISPISGILNRVDHSLRGAASAVAPVAATLPVATILIDAAKTVAAAAAIALPSTPQATKAVQKKTHDIHIVFSTDCTVRRQLVGLSLDSLVSSFAFLPLSPPLVSRTKTTKRSSCFIPRGRSGRMGP